MRFKGKVRSKMLTTRTSLKTLVAKTKNPMTSRICLRPHARRTSRATLRRRKVMIAKRMLTVWTLLLNVVASKQSSLRGGTCSPKSLSDQRGPRINIMKNRKGQGKHNRAKDERLMGKVTGFCSQRKRISRHPRCGLEASTGNPTMQKTTSAPRLRSTHNHLLSLPRAWAFLKVAIRTKHKSTMVRPTRCLVRSRSKAVLRAGRSKTYQRISSWISASVLKILIPGNE